MKERGILMSSPMVSAILAGTKTQTRRAIKPVPERRPDWSRPGVDGIAFYRGKTLVQTVAERSIDIYQDDLAKMCPYGAPGDRLWVRETWRVRDAAESDIDYLADASTRRFLTEGDAAWWKRWRGHSFRKDGEPKFCPSIYMPRWASRITLDVTSVRVQRLHDISEEDARAEGAEREDGCADCAPRWDPTCPECGDYRSAFAALWRSINGPESWAANPWVWRISFSRTAAPEHRP